MEHLWKIIFIQAEILLQGHEYGAPDKFGSYAIGLYQYEVHAIDGFLPNLLLIVGILAVIQILCAPALARRRKMEENGSYSPETLLAVFKPLTIISVGCTIWAGLHYLLFN